jgi:hypothetical protein
LKKEKVQEQDIESLHRVRKIPIKMNGITSGL